MKTKEECEKAMHTRTHSSRNKKKEKGGKNILIVWPRLVYERGHCVLEEKKGFDTSKKVVQCTGRLFNLLDRL